MTEEMERNTDITYQALPPKPCKYKILIIIAFNSKEFKSLLCKYYTNC